MTDNEHIDELIAKYFSGEASPEEAAWLDDWQDADPENAAYFEGCRKIFAPADARPDVQRMLASVRKQMGPETAAKPRMILVRNYAMPLRIAASVIVASMIAAAAWLYFQRAPQQPSMELSSAAATRQEQLADGSRIFMNRHTTLTVEENYNKAGRKVKLKGEAFFEVIHHDGQPFVIDAGGVSITDIGTSFNVKAHPDSDTVLVSVVEGIVDMSNGITTLRLHRDESAMYIRSRNALTMIPQPKNIATYKTRVFHFKAATLAEVIGSVNEAYGPVLSLNNPDLEACLITVDFSNESPETIAAVIAETLGLTIEKTAGGYAISGPTCLQ